MKNLLSPRLLILVTIALLCLMALKGVNHLLTPRAISISAATHPEVDPRFRNDGKELMVWINAAEEVVRRSGDAEAAEVMNYLKRHACLATLATDSMPIYPIRANKDPESVIILLQKRDRPNPIIKLLFRKHAEMPDWRYGMANGTRQNIPDVPDTYTVLNQDAPLSPRHKGLVLLHEGWHVRTINQHPTISHEEDEGGAWKFMLRIWGMCGGEPYKQLRQKAMEEVHASFYHQGARKLSDIGDLDDRHDKELIRIFGKPEYPLELERWRYFLYTDATLELVKTFPEPNRSLAEKAANRYFSGQPEG